MERDRNQRFAAQDGTPRDDVATRSFESDHIGSDSRIHASAEPGRDISAGRRASDDDNIGAGRLDDGRKRPSDRQVVVEPRITRQVDRRYTRRGQRLSSRFGVCADNSTSQLRSIGGR